MVKFYIQKSDVKRFRGIFKFFFAEKCELCIFPEEGLKWRNQSRVAQGIIYKDAFVDWNFNHRQKLGVVDLDTKETKNWFNKWKDLGLIVEIGFK